MSKVRVVKFKGSSGLLDRVTLYIEEVEKILRSIREDIEIEDGVVDLNTVVRKAHQARGYIELVENLSDYSWKRGV